MTLREELESLGYHLLQGHDGAKRRFLLRDDVLAIFDRYVDEAIARYQREAAPSERRPARDALELYGSSEAHIGRAIVEAIDALTAAIREAKR